VRGMAGRAGRECSWHCDDVGGVQLGSSACHAEETEQKPGLHSNSTTESPRSSTARYLARWGCGLPGGHQSHQLTVACCCQLAALPASHGHQLPCGGHTQWPPTAAEGAGHRGGCWRFTAVTPGVLGESGRASKASVQVLVDRSSTCCGFGLKTECVFASTATRSKNNHTNRVMVKGEQNSCPCKQVPKEHKHGLSPSVGL